MKEQRCFRSSLQSSQVKLWTISFGDPSVTAHIAWRGYCVRSLPEPIEFMNSAGPAEVILHFLLSKRFTNFTERDCGRSRIEISHSRAPSAIVPEAGTSNPQSRSAALCALEIFRAGFVFVLIRLIAVFGESDVFS